MGRYFKTTSIPLVDYSYKLPYQELLGAVKYRQGRQDKAIDSLMKAQDALSKVDYVPGTEHEKYLNQKRQQLSNQVSQLAKQDLSGSYAPVADLINEYVSDPNLLDIQRTADHVKAQDLVRQDYIAKGLYHPDYNPINWQESIDAGFGTDDYSWRQGLMEYHKGFDQSKADAARRSYFNDMTAAQRALPGAVEQRAIDNGLSYALTPLGDMQMRYEGIDPSTMSEAEKEEWGIQALMQQAPEFDNYLTGKTSTKGGGGGGTPTDMPTSMINAALSEMAADPNGMTTVNPIAMQKVIGTTGRDPLLTSLSEQLSSPVFDLETGLVLDDGTGNEFQDNYNRITLRTYDEFLENSEVQERIKEKNTREKNILKEINLLELGYDASAVASGYGLQYMQQEAAKKRSLLTAEEKEAQDAEAKQKIEVLEKELASLESMSNFEYLENTDIGKQLIKNARKKGIDLKDAELTYPKYKEWKESNMNPLSILSKAIDAGGIKYRIEVSGDQRNMQIIWDAENRKNTILVDAFATFDQEALDNITANAVDDNDNELFENEEDAIKKLGLIKETVFDNNGKPTDQKSYKIPYKHVFSPSASNMWQYEIGSGNSGDKAKAVKHIWRDIGKEILAEQQIIKRQEYNTQKNKFEINKFGKRLDDYNLDPDKNYSSFITDQLGSEAAVAITELQENSSIAAVGDVLNLLETSVNNSSTDPQSRADAAFIGASLKGTSADPGTNLYNTQIETISKNILSTINLGGAASDYLDADGTGIKDLPLYKTRAKNQALSLGLVEVDFSKIPNINMTSQVYAPYAAPSVVEGLTALGQALGSPIDVSGLYRTPAYNNAISHTGHKGVHTRGKGVDVSGANKQIISELFSTMDAAAIEQKFGIVKAIDEGNHLHLRFK